MGKIVTLKDRTFERTQGCWNCIHSQSGADYWKSARLANLQRAATLVEENPAQGEEHPKVLNIRRMVNTVDHAVATRVLLRCTHGRKADGSPVADLVENNFLCDRWTGAEGSSLAREIGKTDKLPEELTEDLDGAAPDLNELLGKKIVS